MAGIARPFIPWIGSKEKLIPYIWQVFPPSPKLYLEPFGGGGALLLGMQPKVSRMDIYNDFNCDLVNLFLCARECTVQLVRELKFIPFHSRAEFDLLKEFMKHKELLQQRIADERNAVMECFSGEEREELLEILRERSRLFDVQRAAAYYKVCRGSFSGTTSSFGVKPNNLTNFLYLFDDASKRLQDVIIENKDCLDIIRERDGPDSLIYCDPPYFDAESLYAVDFPKEKHEELHWILSQCKGYTGFWNGESKASSFVCISLTDEDPENEMEEKAATWRMVQNGGFYWAGAYACDDFVIVGTDDGDAQCSYLYLLDPLTGKVLDFKSGFDGDIRSTICYDDATKAYYFTSKGGTFYRAKVEAQNGSYAITACDGLKLDNGSDDPALPPMSTSTPVVYNGRAYIGVSGTGQFTQYSGHNITVIDLENWKIAYKVPTQGYPQTSGLLTTAYEQDQDNGYVYVYFFDNYTPGTLRVLRDKKGQDEANYLTSETFNDETYQTAYALFSPNGKQAQYAICSPITDSDGTIYFKNDSGYLMAFGRSIEKIEVTKQPDKTQYNAGDIFDKTGMVVTATLLDGSTRDVTDMVSASSEPLKNGTTKISLEFGRDQIMYRNSPIGSAMIAGSTIAAITTTVQIRVGEGTVTWGDVNGDGKVNSTDAVLILRYAAQLGVDIDTAAADVNGDGKINSTDAVLILRYAAQLITKFPVEG